MKLTGALPARIAHCCSPAFLRASAEVYQLRKRGEPCLRLESRPRNTINLLTGGGPPDGWHENTPRFETLRVIACRAWKGRADRCSCAVARLACADWIEHRCRRRKARTSRASAS